MSPERKSIKVVIERVCELLQSSDEARWCEYFAYVLFLLGDPNNENSVARALGNILGDSSSFSVLNLHSEGCYLIEANEELSELKLALRSLCQAYQLEENRL